MGRVDMNAVAALVCLFCLILHLTLWTQTGNWYSLRWSGICFIFLVINVVMMKPPK